MNKKLLALYGLKWNPFAPDVPVEALARVAPHRVVLLARRATRRRRRLRPRHRRARHRQVRHAAHPRRAPRRTTRRQGRHPHAAAGRPPRLLSRDGRSVRRRAAPRQPLGRRQAAARSLADPHRCRPVAARADRRRGPGDAAGRARPSCGCCRRPGSTAISCSPSCSPATAACWSACAPTSWSRSTAACACAWRSSGRRPTSWPS